MNTRDARVVRAMGARFEEFRVLAMQCAEYPELRPQVERQIGEMLQQMNEQERTELKSALLAAGWPRKAK